MIANGKLSRVDSNSDPSSTAVDVIACEALAGNAPTTRPIHPSASGEAGIDQPVVQVFSPIVHALPIRSFLVKTKTPSTTQPRRSLASDSRIDQISHLVAE